MVEKNQKEDSLSCLNFEFSTVFQAPAGLLPSLDLKSDESDCNNLQYTEDFRAGRFDRFKTTTPRLFCLESGKENLCRRIIVTIAFCQHRSTIAVDIQQSAIFHVRVLTPAISMNNRLRSNQTATRG
jgi:hypothetical protein